MTAYTVTGSVTTVQGSQPAGLTLTVDPPANPAGVLYGTSYLDAGVATAPAIDRLLTPAVMRSYNTGAVNGWADSNGSKLPIGVIPLDSCKTAPDYITTGDAATIAAMRDWLLNGTGIRIWDHEPEKKVTPAVFQAVYKVLLGLDLKDRLATCIMAFDLSNGSDPEAFVVKGVKRLCYDCYGVHTSSGQSYKQITDAAAHARAHGLPWYITELGYQAISSTNPYPSDAVLLPWLQGAVKVINALPNPPVAVSLMNHGAQLMDGRANPLSTAYYASL